MQTFLPYPDFARSAQCLDRQRLGNNAFHLSHRSNLIRKLPSHYGPLWPNVPDNLPYIWPV